MVELGERSSAEGMLEQRGAYSMRGEGFPSPQAASSVLLNLSQLVQSGEVDTIAPYPTGFDPPDGPQPRRAVEHSSWVRLLRA
jgi:hypothetical protein